MKKQTIIFLIISLIIIIPVYPINNEGTDTETFSVGMQQLQTCPPLSKACSTDNGNEVIKQCNTDGTAYSIIQTCGEEQECTLTSDSAICEASGGSKTTYITSNEDYVVALLILIIIVLGYIIYKLKKKR